MTFAALLVSGTDIQTQAGRRPTIAALKLTDRIDILTICMKRAIAGAQD